MPAMDRAPVAVAMATLASPWGPVLVAGTSTGIASVDLRGEPPALQRALAERFGEPVVLVAGPAGPASGLLASAVAALVDALEDGGADLAGVPLDWTGIQAWDRRVLDGARTIGPGEVTSYGRLARRIGAPGAARAVGGALGRNPFWLFVPCHRVVAGDGSLGGYGDDPDALDIKRDLLAREGIALPITRLVD